MANRRINDIPACAWHRPLGDIPPEAAKATIAHGHFGTKDRAKKGMPLGGIGAGTFMYNLCGSFGPWYMKPGRYEERFLRGAAFHIYERVGDDAAIVKTLATDDVLSAWDALERGEGDYYALFPRGWCTYKPFQTEITLTFFSPVIKDNYRETSFPVGVFLFHLANTGASPVRLGVMFSFPNAPYTGPNNLQASSDVLMGDYYQKAVDSHLRERTGLANTVVRADDLTAILMTADSANNPAETRRSAWCIASTGSASYATVWDSDGDGAALWDDFAADGKLENTGAQPATSPAGALAQTVTLAPGEEMMVPFVLAWDFPFIEFAAGTRWLRRYTEYFRTGPGNALDIAREGIVHWADWLKAVEGWTSPIIDSPAYPDWLKQGALNELYYSTFGGSFWENGCVTKPKQFGARPGQHLCSVMECQEYPFAETFDVRHHAARVTRDLWPQIERDILLADADFILDTPDGSGPHDAGSPHGDPFFAYDAYKLMAPPDFGAGEDRDRRTTPWSEFSPKFIQQSFAYWRKTGDDAFLDEIWAAAVRTFHYQVSTDTDGDGITEMMSSEYGDNKFFNAVLWIGALEMLKVMAQAKGDRATAQAADEQLTTARRTAETTFWNQELGYYQFNACSDRMMGDAFVGQRYVEVSGLPPVLDPDRMVSHFRQAFRIASLLPDTDGDGIGNLGIGNALTSDGQAGGVDNIARHDQEVWVGVSYVLAASMYHWGTSINDGALQAGALMLAWGVHQQTWRNDATGYWFNTPEAWDIDSPAHGRAPMYQRARGIWELLMEIHDPFAESDAR
jgi:non-lysosomal glucosylceramidase